MQFVAMTRRKTDEFTEAQFAPILDAEAEHAREFYADGFVRQIWMRGDTPGAVMMVEAEDEAEVRANLATLPLYVAGMLEIVAVVPLKPYRAFCPKNNPMFKSLANKLTVSRIAVIPVILLLLAVPQAWAAWVALILFAIAGLTDYLDGYMARRENDVTVIGQFLDPIADKLLVAAVLLMLVYNQQISGMTVLPAVIILMREVAVSGLREFLAGLRVSVPVSALAKWKTTIQMLALGFLIVGRYAPESIPSSTIGDFGLWFAGMVTLITAWDYWRASLKHF